jgi:hypothetical protein
MKANAAPVAGVAQGGNAASLLARLSAYDSLAPDVRHIIQTAPVQMRVDHLPELQSAYGPRGLAKMLREQLAQAFPGWQEPRE